MEKVYPEVSPWSTTSAPIGLIPPPPDDYNDDGDYDCNFILVILVDPDKSDTTDG